MAPLVESEEEVRQPFEVGITISLFGDEPLRTVETFPIAIAGTLEVAGACYDDQRQGVSGFTLRILDAVDRSVLAVGEPPVALDLADPTRMTVAVERDAPTAMPLDACELDLTGTRPALSATPLTSEQDAALEQAVQDFGAFRDAKGDTVRLRISGADDQASRDLYRELGARLQGSERLVDMLLLVSVVGEISSGRKKMADKDMEMIEDEMDEIIEELKKGYDDAREQMEEAQRIGKVSGSILHDMRGRRPATPNPSEIADSSADVDGQIAVGTGLVPVSPGRLSIPP